MLEKTPDTKERARVLGRERVLKAGGGGQRTDVALNWKWRFLVLRPETPLNFPPPRFSTRALPSFRLREGVRIHATRRLPFDYVRTCSKPGGGDDHVRPTA